MKLITKKVAKAACLSIALLMPVSSMAQPLTQQVQKPQFNNTFVYLGVLSNLFDCPELEFPLLPFPDCEWPDLGLPKPELPDPELPSPELPEPELPEPELPEPELPEPELPEPELPEPELPEPELPKPEIPSPEVPKPEIPEPEVIPPTPSTPQATLEQEVLTLVNKERTSRGLSALSMDTNVQKVARLKSEDMQKNNYFSHTSPTYGSPFDMLKQFNIHYTSAGENIAMGYTTATAVVEGWMNSPGHRQNILNPSYTHMGVGYHAAGNYWTQLFIGR